MIGRGHQRISGRLLQIGDGAAGRAGGPGQLEGPNGVVGEELCPVPGSFAGLGPDPRRHGAMAFASKASGDLPVRDVSDEAMGEPVFDVLAHGRCGHARHQASALELREPLERLPLGDPRQRRDAPGPERVAGNGGVLQQ